MLRLTPSIGVRTSKLKRSSVRSEVTFSWIEEQDGYIKSHEIETTGLGVNQHQAGYWTDLVNTKALLGQNGYRVALANPQRCALKVDTNHRVPLRGSERYASVIKGSQAGIWNNEERLLIINLREAVSFRARMWLVVAMRLQGQHHSFRLRTSSNTPFVLMNVAHGSFHRFRERNAISIVQLWS
jgi:hypothetical protein